MSFNIFLKTQLKRDQSTPLFSLEFIICHFIVGLALGVGYSNLAVAEVSNLASEYRIAVSTHLEDTYSENSFLNSSQQTVYQADTLLLDVDWVKSETQVIQFQASIISQLTPKSWYLARDEKEEPVLQINSEPLEQNAYDFSVKWIDYLDKSIRKWGFEFVEKQDLSALLIEYGKSYQFSQSHRTLGLKASIETVNIKPETIGGSEPRFSSKYNDTLKLDLNFSQVINAKMLMNMGILLAFQSGYLSDPYLLTAVYVSELNDGDLALAQDTRPNSRVSTILSLGLRKNILSNAQSAHLGYEFYSDNWELSAQILFFRMNYSRTLLDWGYSLRHYSQSGSYFYEPFHTVVRADNYYSSDFQMAPFSALSLELYGKVKLGENFLNISVERYDSGAVFSFFERDSYKNPGLIDFWRLTLGIERSF